MYNYVDLGVFSFRNIDLPRKVKYKKRKENEKQRIRRETAIRKGRTYEDFQKYIGKNPECSIVEMDTVEGVKGGKVFLTLLFRQPKFMLIYLMDNKNMECVEKAFKNIKDIVGIDTFKRIFEVILTDNGSEFFNPISIEKDAKTELKYKVIVVGNSGVGKSCLSLRAIQDIFKENYELTLGTEIYNFKVKVNETPINLQIWDTCGQEKYRSLIKNYYQNSSLAIIVYSVIDQNSFQDVNEWYKEVKLNTSADCKVFLIANKVDLPERKVSMEQGNKCKNDFKFDLFMETSAKSGFNSKELFMNGAKLLYKEYENLNNLDKNKKKNEEKILNNIKKKKFALKKDDDEDDDDSEDNEGNCCS
jgi:small GTP-binding protein